MTVKEKEDIKTQQIRPEYAALWTVRALRTTTPHMTLNPIKSREESSLMEFVNLLRKNERCKLKTTNLNQEVATVNL